MKKTGWLGIRLEPEIEDALMEAALKNDRKKADMGRIILKEWLREHGYLEGERKLLGREEVPPKRSTKKA